MAYGWNKEKVLLYCLTGFTGYVFKAMLCSMMMRHTHFHIEDICSVSRGFYNTCLNNGSKCSWLAYPSTFRYNSKNEPQLNVQQRTAVVDDEIVWPGEVNVSDCQEYPRRDVSRMTGDISDRQQILILAMISDNDHKHERWRQTEVLQAIKS